VQYWQFCQQGRRTVKAFDVVSRFVHLEFFVRQSGKAERFRLNSGRRLGGTDQ
jgi:hypothetical protein